MTFEKLFEKVKKMAANADVSDQDFLAVQINVTGKDEKESGVFYVEIKDHKLSVEPYDYHDRQCAITMNNEDFIKMMDGKLDSMVAFGLGKLKLEGDAGKAIEFSKLLKKKGK